MKYEIDYRDLKPLGRTGESIPALGLGTWDIRDYVKAEEVFIEAVNVGLSMIDTAEMYGSGKAEEFVGKVLREVGRENVFLITKMLPHNTRSRDRVIKAGRAALRRLGVECVDLYLIHWPSTSVSIGEQVRNFESLLEEGIARYIGVSNFDVEELEEAVSSLRRGEIVLNQVRYSVLTKQYVEEVLLKKALNLGVSIQAYTPLEKGYVAKHPAIREIAEEVRKTPVQVALNYVISRPSVTAVPKTENLLHLKDIAGALGWRLPPEAIEALERL